MRRKYPRFVIRTIKKGRIKIFGKFYYPDNRYMEYDGRLDNMRYAFGIYEKYTPDGIIPDDCVSMWGSEKAFRGLESPNEGKDVINGYFPWMLWHAE